MTTRKARRRRSALPIIAATAVALGALSAPALGAELNVTKTVDASSLVTDLDQDWGLSKTVSPVGPVTTSEDSVAATWTVTATEGDRVAFRRFASGTITVQNPNAETITFDLTENAPSGELCGLSESGTPPITATTLTDLSVQGNNSITVNWRCRLLDVGATSYDNAATATWEPTQTADTTDLGSTTSVTETIDFAGVTNERDFDATVPVADPSIPALAFDATVGGDNTRTAPQDIPVPALGCETTSNTATLDQGRGPDRPATARVDVCRDIIAPEVTKTTKGSWLRIFDWKLDKRADAKSGYNHRGYFVRMGYTIDADRRVAARKNFRIGGRIKVTNPNTVPLTVTDVSDVLSQGAAAFDGASCSVIDGPSALTPAVIAPAGDLIVRYRCTFADDIPAGDLLGKDDAFTNVATATYVDDVDSTTTQDSPGVEVIFNGKNRRDLFDRVRITDRLGDTIKILSRGLDKSDELRDIRYLRAPKRGCVRHVNVARLVAVDADGKAIKNAKGDPRLRKTARETVRICQKATPSGVDPAPVVYSSEDPAKGVPAAPVKDQDTEDVEEPTINEPGSVVDRPERLRVRKSVVGKKRVEIGDRVIFRIAVKNRGDELARNVRVRDVLPRHLKAKAVRGKTRALRGLNRRVLNLRLPNIPAGKTRVIKIVTKVVSRPEVTPRNLRVANRAKGAKRRVAVARLQKGITCNVAIGRARAFRPDRDGACIRILPEEVLTP